MALYFIIIKFDVQFCISAYKQLYEAETNLLDSRLVKFSAESGQEADGLQVY